MNRIIIMLICTFSLSMCNAQEKDTIISMKNLEFIEGKWKAIAKDSSFSTILEYKFSPEHRLLLATNHLYGKSGKLFGVYEGAYLLENGKFIYFLSGPKGETHKGIAELKNDTLIHRAVLYPGKGTKSYLSEMVLKNDKLYYYANYSKNVEFPTEIDYSEPLIYYRIKE